MKKLNHKGFAALEGILIFIIVAIIGGIGWYAIHTKHQTDKILSQADKISQSTPHTSAKSNTKTTAQKNLTIPEWKVEATYSGTMDLTYSVNDNNSPPSVASFSSKQMDAEGCQNAGGWIARYLNTDKVKLEDGSDSGKTSSEFIKDLDKPLYTKVGNYYFIYSHAQSACTTTNTSITDQAKTNDEVKSLLPSLKATQ